MSDLSSREMRHISKVTYFLLAVRCSHRPADYNPGIARPGAGTTVDLQAMGHRPILRLAFAFEKFPLDLGEAKQSIIGVDGFQNSVIALGETYGWGIGHMLVMG